MCGIVGIYHKNEPACGDVYDALIQVQHRGQDAAGISTWDRITEPPGVPNISERSKRGWDKIPIIKTNQRGNTKSSVPLEGALNADVLGNNRMPKQALMAPCVMCKTL